MPMAAKPARPRHLDAYLRRLLPLVPANSPPALRRNQRDALFSGSVSWFALGKAKALQLLAANNSPFSLENALAARSLAPSPRISRRPCSMSRPAR
jgi:hypothetical protein